MQRMSLQRIVRAPSEMYFLALAETTDDALLLEETNLNVFRETWLQNESRIKGISRSEKDSLNTHHY